MGETPNTVRGAGREKDESRGRARRRSPRYIGIGGQPILAFSAMIGLETDAPKHSLVSLSVYKYLAPGDPRPDVAALQELARGVLDTVEPRY